MKFGLWLDAASPRSSSLRPEIVARWTDETGAVTLGSAQTFWAPKGGRAMLRASTFSLDAEPLPGYPSGDLDLD